MKLFPIFLLIIFNSCFLTLRSQTPKPVQIALMKYSGGGDWYCNPTALPNLVKFCNKNLGTNISEDIANVEPGSSEIFNYPFIHMTGHGNVIFSEQEVRNLRAYLIGGGFLHIDDCYGMDKFIRPHMKKIFPELELVELPYDHPVFHQKFIFKNGCPKIHEHDGLTAQAFGYIYNGRLVLLYTYQTDLGDGWEDPDVHHDSEFIRTKALQMGADIIQYVFNQ